MKEIIYSSTSFVTYKTIILILKSFSDITKVVLLIISSDTSSINYWTQGNDLAEDGTWIWGYPEGLSFSFTNWAPSEPNNYHHTGVK